MMLALMQGMQDIQRKLVEKEGRTEEPGIHGGIEFVRGQHELPKLPEWSASSAPIDLNDWLVLIEPIMADLTASSQEWWETLLSEARKWYDSHMKRTPLERLTHHPTPSEELTQEVEQAGKTSGYNVAHGNPGITAGRADIYEAGDGDGHHLPVVHHIPTRRTSGEGGDPEGVGSSAGGQQLNRSSGLHPEMDEMEVTCKGVGGE